ncbi:MAG: hypothetical protein ACRD6W_15575 [Nitrososphaerales archaeon]
MRSDSAVYSRRRKAFIHKTAKSVSEIQSNVNNLADVLVFLEVLGYSAKTVREHGFKDMRDLARNVYEVIDFYDSSTSSGAKPFLYRMPTIPRRLIEGLALSAPWLMMLPLVFIFGFSLWMDWHLPAAPMTALALGVLVGMIVSEGQIWMFSRLFLFYHSQSNLAETRRIIRRSYALFAVLIATTAVTLLVGGLIVNVPLELIGIASVAAVTMAFHRFSFTVVFTLRKIMLSLLAYGGALATLLTIYFLTPGLITDQVTRYLASLGGAFLVLVAAALYCTRMVLSPSTSRTGAETPHFFKPLNVNKETLRSSFQVQVWENAPYYLYGTFFIVMLFGDRIISWAYNPVHTAGVQAFPLVFNTAYHMGADTALFVLFPVGIVQYVMVGHVFELLHNVSLESPSTDPSAIDRFVRRRYLQTLLVTLTVSGSIAAALVIAAPSVIGLLKGTAVSVGILRVAALSNVFLAVFTANSSFVMLLNRAKTLAAITLVCALVLGVGGILLGRLGFQDIVLAYLCSCVTAAALSSLEARRLMKKPSSLFLSRF